MFPFFETNILSAPRHHDPHSGQRTVRDRVCLYCTSLEAVKKDAHHRPAEGIPLRRPQAPVEAAYPFWSAAAEDRGNGVVHHHTPTSMQLDDGEPSERFHVRQGLGQRFISSPLLFDILDPALVDVILQRFVADTATVLDSGCLNDAPKGGNGDCVNERMPERVQRSGWGTLYADNAGTTSRSAIGLAKMML